MQLPGTELERSSVLQLRAVFLDLEYQVLGLLNRGICWGTYCKKKPFYVAPVRILIT